jgi:hypothetical protein
MSDEGATRMKSVIRAMIQKQHESSPVGRRQDRAEVEKAFAGMEGVDEDYKEFVVRQGCGNIGAYPIYGMGKGSKLGKVAGESTVFDVTAHWLSPKRLGGRVDWVLVFSFDGSGNPIGFAKDGTVWIYDIDLGGGLCKLGEGFEDFLEKWALDRELEKQALREAQGVRYTFEPRWKDELICGGAKGKFVLDFKMDGGAGPVYFPNEEAWEESCPAWAKGEWGVVKEQLVEWCREKKVKIKEDGLFEVMKYRESKGG